MPKSVGKVRGSGSNSISRLFCGRRAYLLALFIYALIAFVVFYPGFMHPLTGVPGISGSSSYESIWNVWRVDYSLFTLHKGIWYSNLIYWPVGASLIFQVYVPLSSILAYPFTLVSIPLAYNIIFLSGMVFSGLAMMLLSDYILDNKYAAFIAGVIFAFSAFHIAASYPDIDFTNIGWIPLCIYLFLRILDQRYWKAKHGKYLIVLGLAVAFTLMFYTANPEQLIITLMAFVVIVLYYLATKKSRALVANREFVSLMALFVVLFLALNSWEIAAVLSRLSAGGGVGTLNQQSNLAYNRVWSANLVSFVTLSYYNGLVEQFGHWRPPRYGTYIATGTTYIGFTVLALTAFGLYRYRRKLYLWAAVCIVFFLISLGPYVQLGTINTGIPGPYLLLRYLPIISFIREPGRFLLIITLAFAIMAAYGFKFISEKIGALNKSQAVKVGVLALISIMVLAESSAPPLSAGFASNVVVHFGISSFYASLGKQQGNFAVLDLPAVENNRSSDPAHYPAKAMLTTMYSHKPIIGGYVSRWTAQEMDSEYIIPLAVEATNLEATGIPSYFSPISENYTDQTILLMRLDNISYVTVDKSAFAPYGLDSMEHYLITVFGNPVYQDNSIIAFSTAAAVGQPMYQGFVGYPEFAYWNMTAYEGKYFWVPNGDGPIEVYAPYPQANVSAGGQEGAETRVNLTAVALGRPSAVLRVSVNTTDGLSQVASFNLTATPEDCSFEVMMAPGMQGNKLYFTSEGNYSIGVSAVSFSLGSPST